MAVKAARTAETLCKVPRFGTLLATTTVKTRACAPVMADYLPGAGTGAGVVAGAAAVAAAGAAGAGTGTGTGAATGAGAVAAFFSIKPSLDVPARWDAKLASTRVEMKNTAAAKPVDFDMKFDEPVAPNRLPEAPEPNAAPMSAPLPC